jgi:transcriptional regulator GlxA family with amidase domain
LRLRGRTQPARSAESLGTLQHAGTAAQNRAARRCVVSPFREGGQAQFIERPVAEVPDASTAPARWALARLDEKITVADLARVTHMSERTLVRRFTEETGLAPRRWLTLQRLARARELLEESDLSVEEIAAAVGYATATSLRNHLTAEVGLSPGRIGAPSNSPPRRPFRHPRPDDRGARLAAPIIGLASDALGAGIAVV